MVERAGNGDNEEFDAVESPDAANPAEPTDTPDTGTAAEADDSDAIGYPWLDDLSTMHSDDALLSALGAGTPDAVGDVGDRELNELLLAWRRDIDSEPMAELVDTDTAVAAIKTATAAERRTHRARGQRAFVPVAVAAAVLMIAFTGTSLAARNAEPGDPLWGLTQVLYTEHAQSVQAAFSARLELDTADRALAHGRFRKAAEALNEAAAAIRQVQPEDNQQRLQAQHNQLELKLPEVPDATKSATPEEGTSAPVSSTPSTKTSSPAEPSSSAEPSKSTEPTPPTTSSPPEVPPTTSSSTTTSPPTTRQQSDEASGGGVSPKLESTKSPQTQGSQVN